MSDALTFAAVAVSLLLSGALVCLWISVDRRVLRLEAAMRDRGELPAYGAWGDGK